MKIIIPKMTDPAANRYTKIFPVCLQTCLMLHFYSVMPKAVRWLTQGSTGHSDEDNEVLGDPDAILGAPANPILHMRKLQAKQQDKLRQLFENCDANSMLCLVWVVVVKLIMRLHYRLFKRGTWYNRQQSRKEADRRFGCFDFCGGHARNPAALLLTSITNMMLNPENAGASDLNLLFLKYGSFVDWPLALLVALHTSLVKSFCRIWRLLVWHFDCYPWLLAPGYDPRASSEQREKAFLDFLALPKGSQKLDAGMARKLRELVNSYDDLMEPTLYDFVKALFERVVVTSTYVERIFKYLTHRSSKHPSKVPTLGAKHVNTEFDAIVRAWRAGQGGSGHSGKTRPAWVRTSVPGSHLTGLHLFEREQSFTDINACLGDGLTQASIFHKHHCAALTSWSALSEEERRDYTTRASRLRNGAHAEQSRLDSYIHEESKQKPRAGPWQLSSRQGKFPLHEDIIREAMDGNTMAGVAKRWDVTVRDKVEPDPTFPKTVVSGDVTRHDIPESCTQVVSEMLDMLRLSLRYCDQVRAGGLLLECCHGQLVEYVFAGHSMKVVQEDFEAEMLGMRRLDEVPASGLVGFLLQYTWHTTDPWLQVETEIAYVTRLALKAAVVWDIFVLSGEPVALNSWKVTARSQLDLAALRQQHKQQLAQNAAMKAFRLVAGLTRRSKDTGGRHRSRCGTAASGSKRQARKVMEDDTSSESELSSQEEGVASGLAELGEALPGKCPSRVGPRERVMETWGGGQFPFAHIVSKGILVGYGVTCGRHNNEDGHASGTPCKKAITGCAALALGENECKLRLKRWLAAGFFHPLPQPRQRQAHIAIGGKSLNDLGCDSSWAELGHADLDDILRDL